jgi:predicted nicotinamide N-methyase
MTAISGLPGIIAMEDGARSAVDFGKFAFARENADVNE